MMVADSNVAHADVTFTSTKKIQKVGKYLAGVAGTYAPALTYLKTFAEKARRMDGKTVPQLGPIEGDFELLVLSEHGLWLYGEDGTPLEVEDEFYCVGTGAATASACLRTQELLLAAYNLPMALDVACEFDTNSRLPMVQLTLR